MKPISLKAYVRLTAAVKSATNLEGSVAKLSCIVDAWALATSTPSVVAIAFMVGQKTIRLHRRVDRHTIDRHE